MKLYFTEFAEKRSKVLQDLKDHSFTYILYCMSLYLFPNSESTNHWENEILDYFTKVPLLKNGHKLKYRDVYHSIWGWYEDAFILNFNNLIRSLNSKERSNINPKTISDQDRLNLCDKITFFSDYVAKEISTHNFLDTIEAKIILDKIFKGE